MKNNIFKKTLSVFLAVLMVLSAWAVVPGVHIHASAADGTVTPYAWTAVYNGSGDRGDANKIVICSDGEAGNTTVGQMRFNISSFSNRVSNATLTVNTGNHGGSLANSTVNIFMIAPSKCVATSGTYLVNSIAGIYGSNYNSSTGVSNAYNYYGISASDSLGTVAQSSTGSHTFDITNAVNTAKSNGWTDLCILFLMPAIYNDGDGNTWSDLQIYPSGTSLSYTAAPNYSDTGIPIVDINTDAANSVVGLDTDYTTTTGAFGSDNDNLTEADYAAVYHNVLYTDGVVTTGGSGSDERSGWSARSDKTEYGSSGTGSNGLTVYWYHPTATLLYDGDKTNLPRLGVCTAPNCADSTKSPLWQKYLIKRQTDFVFLTGSVLF